MCVFVRVFSSNAGMGVIDPSISSSGGINLIDMCSMFIVGSATVLC
jgi:hypothetical protein